MTEEEINNELEVVSKFVTASPDEITRMYALYRLLFKDKTSLCTKCPAVIKKVFKRLKDYYIQTKK
tara:strand:- start:554 stop:751 length:198 start_codon:yes stop_codon:yes gene_type:complete